MRGVYPRTPNVSNGMYVYACVVYVCVRVFVWGMWACVTRYLIGKRTPHAPHCSVVSVCVPRAVGAVQPRHRAGQGHTMSRSPHTRFPRDWKGWVATPLTDRRPPNARVGCGMEPWKTRGGGWGACPNVHCTWTVPTSAPPYTQCACRWIGVHGECVLCTACVCAWACDQV